MSFCFLALNDHCEKSNKNAKNNKKRSMVINEVRWEVIKKVFEEELTVNKDKKSNKVETEVGRCTTEEYKRLMISNQYELRRRLNKAQM